MKTNTHGRLNWIAILIIKILNLDFEIKKKDEYFIERRFEQDKR